MARYSKIDRRIWNDAKFRSLSRPQPSGQVLFLYLLTNPFVGPIPGIYSAGEAMLAEALGWELEAFREAFAEALQQGLVKADFEARLIWLPNAIRYNEPESTNVVKSWRAAWDELPECKLKRLAWEALRAALVAKDEVAEKNESAWVTAFFQSCPEPSVEGSTKGMPKSCGKGSDKACGKALPNQEQEQDQEQYKTSVHSANEPEESSLAAESGENRPKTAIQSEARAKAVRTSMAMALYSQYPRHQAKLDGIKAIEMAIVSVAQRQLGGDDNAAAEWLRGKLDHYARSPQGSRPEKNLIPLPATWFNGGRYDDDPEEWKYVGANNGRRGQPMPIVAQRAPDERLEDQFRRYRAQHGQEGGGHERPCPRLRGATQSRD